MIGVIFHCDREGCDESSDEMDAVDDVPVQWHAHVVAGEVYHFHHADCALVWLAGFPKEEPKPVEAEADPDDHEDA